MRRHFRLRALPGRHLGAVWGEAGGPWAAGPLDGKMQRAGPGGAGPGAVLGAGPGRALLRRELRLLESIFHRGHERFRIARACPDELGCEFLPGPAGGGPVRIHGNITVSCGGGDGDKEGGGGPSEGRGAGSTGLWAGPVGGWRWRLLASLGKGRSLRGRRGFE